MSDTLWPHELQHSGLPCPWPSPRVCSNSCPLSQWCHPTMSFSVNPFSSCPQFFPASGSFPMSQLFTSGDLTIRASASASVLPTNIQGWFPLGFTSLILLSKELSRVFSSTTVRKLQATKVIHINLLHFYTLTAKDQKEIFKKQFITASKRIKYLWIYLPKETKDL